MKFILSIVAVCVFGCYAVSAWAAMDHASPAEHYSDKAFLSGMLAHHEGAFAMADAYLTTVKGDADAQVKKWAETIKEAQQKEIAQMKVLLNKAGGLDKAAYAHMEAAMTDMLQAQKSASDESRAFVEHMTPHHAGAVEMSLPALLKSTNADIVKLAKNIIQEQSEEIAAFRVWMNKHSH